MVRGTPVEAFRSFLEQELAPAQLTSILARMSSREFAKSFRTTIIAPELFSLAYLNELTCLAADAKGEAPDRFGERAGHYSAKLGLDKPAYRPFFLFLSVANALRVAPMMWSRVYTDGKMTVDARARSARLIVTQFPGNVAGCARATG